MGGPIGSWLEARRQQGTQLRRPGRGTPAPGRGWKLNDRTALGAGQAEAYGERERPPAASGESDQAEDSARGKATSKGKGGTEGRRPPRKRAPDTVGSDARQPPALRGIADKAQADKPHRCRDLYRCLHGELLLEGGGDLHKDAARGAEGVTGHAEAEPLQANGEAWVERRQKKRYRAKRIRRRDIPKGNGQERPVGIPVSDDKLLQAACARILSAISAPEVLAWSDGDRPARGAGEAVRDLSVDRQYGRYGSGVEAAIKGFVDPMDQDWRLEMRRLRLDDRALLGLIRTGLKAGILETDGRGIPPDPGVPQGGVVSPGGANGDWHSAVALGVEEGVQPHCRGIDPPIR